MRSDRLRVVALSVLALVLLAATAQAQVVNVSGSNPPLVNGANLLAAIAGIPAPGPANPWVVKLEPGIYDLGGNQIVMRNFVDIEGHGRDVTYIQTNVSLSPTIAAVEVPLGVEAELRQLTVRNGANGSGVGINVDSSTFLLTEVNIEVKVGLDGVGVRTNSVSPRINEVFAQVVAGGGGIGYEVNRGGTVITQSLGVVFSNEKTFGAVLVRSEAVLDGLILLVFKGVRTTGIYVDGRGTPEIINCRVTADVSSDESFGLWVVNSAAPAVKESTFTAINDRLAISLYSQSAANPKATESTFIARPASVDHPNVYGVRVDGGNALVNQSNIDSTSLAVQALGVGTARFGASQLIGAVAGPLGSLRCIFAYNNLYNARAANCI